MANNPINYDMIDYKKLYLEKYKKLPKTYYIITLVTVIAAGLLDILISTDLLGDSYEGLFSFLVGTEDYISAILALAIWVVIAIGTARLVRYLTAIGLSQKIVVADTLLDIGNRSFSGVAAPEKNSAPRAQSSSGNATLERIARLQEQGLLTEEEASKMRADALSGN